jgi:acetyltransferase-like isoleucine patch superfamily enzyme
MNMSFKEIGVEVKIYQPISLIQPENMVLKNHIILSEFSYFASGLGLFIGNYIHISTHCSILGGGYCIINDFSGICAGSRIITGSEDINGGGITGGPTVPREFRLNFQSYVILEKHSFLASNCVVLPGVTIGEGTVVGSNSVVTKDLEPWGIYIGNPAKRVKDRPKEKILTMEQELFEKYAVRPSDFSKEMILAKQLK